MTGHDLGEPCPKTAADRGGNLGEPGGEPSVAWGFGFFCGIFVCVCFFIRLLACLARMLGQHSSTSRPRRTNIALRRPNIAPRWANIAPRWTNIASKMGQHSFKARQHSPKISQHSPQTDQHSFEDGATAPSPPFPLCWPAPGCQASAFKYNAVADTARLGLRPWPDFLGSSSTASPWIALLPQDNTT